MKRILAYMLLLVVAISATAETVNCKAGYLHKKIADKSITELKIIGTIDATDLQFVAHELKQLQELDMSEADVVAMQVLLDKGETYAANELPAGCFASTSLSKVVMPQRLEKIGMGAFAGCENLAEVTLNAKLVKIGDYAFSDCVALQQVTMPVTMQTIGKRAFAHCQALIAVQLPACTAIGDDAFADCAMLSSVSLPQEVTKIGAGAFAQCAALQSVTVANDSKLATIGEKAFVNTSLSSFDFAKCNKLQTIGMWAFANTKLTQVALPSSVESVGVGAFFYDTELNEVVLPQGCDSIPAFALTGANNVGNIEDILTDDTKTIGAYAFYGWDKLLAFVLPKNVEMIGDRAFAKNTSLTKIETERSTPAQLGEAVFEGVDVASVTLVVSDKAPYEAAEQWRDFKIVAPSGINDVSADATQVKVYFAGTMLMIESAKRIAAAELYDANGIALCKISPNGVTAQIEMANYRSNLYIVNLMLEGGVTQVYKLTR